jgi:hypothetical protein
VRRVAGSLGDFYTIGFFVAFRMMWVDLTDRYLVLESAIGHIGQALLCSLYAPITFTGLDDSVWVFPFLFLFGFTGAWFILSVRERRKKKHPLCRGFIPGAIAERLDIAAGIGRTVEHRAEICTC